MKSSWYWRRSINSEIIGFESGASCFFLGIAQLLRWRQDASKLRKCWWCILYRCFLNGIAKQHSIQLRESFNDHQSKKMKWLTYGGRMKVFYVWFNFWKERCLECLGAAAEGTILMYTFITEPVHISAEKRLFFQRALRENKANHDSNHPSLPMLVSMVVQPLWPM